MNPTPEKNLDDELSNIIDESEGDAAGLSNEGIVEAGIPPDISDNSSSTDDESFSIDDFESDFDIKKDLSNNDDSHTDSENLREVNNEHSNSSREQTINNGVVTEFREALSDLTRQVELDRLAFLHGKLAKSGKKIPSLNDIASDIKGSSPMFPKGDYDLYDTRPSSRLDGWISGLSFGSNRRAKRFHK